MAIVGSASIRISPDTSGFRAQLTRELKTVTEGMTAKIKVHVDTGAARAELAAIKREVDQLARQRAEVKVDVDGAARARAEMAAVEQDARRLNGTRINLDLGNSVGGLLSLRGAMVAAIPVAVQLTSALGPLVGVLGAIPGALVGVGQSAGALGLAFHGIGGAIKEATTNQAAAAKQSTATASAVTRSAGQIKNAQVALAQAQRGLANVRRDNAAGAAADARTIAEAQRSLADAHRQASRQQQDDLSAIADAQKSARRAQQDLNTTRREAVVDLRAMNKELADAARDASLDARSAERGLQAQQAENAAIQADPTKSKEEKQRSAAALVDATSKVEQAERKERDAANESAKARKKGVDDTQGVIDAKRAVADAEERITDAQDEQARHRADSARAINDAERGIEDAQRQRHQNALDRADALKTAQEGVASAQRGLTDAHKKSTDALDKQTDAATKTTKAYDGLTQAGRDFVDAYLDVRKTLGRIGRAVQEATLPGFTKFLRDANKVLPEFQDELVATGDAFGDLASDAGDLIKGPFGEQLEGIMRSNNRALRRILGVDDGGGLEGMVQALGNIAEAAEPFTEWLGGLVDDFGLWAKNTTAVNLQNGKMAKFFEDTKQTLKTVGSILGNVFTAVINIGKAAFPSGTGLLGSLDEVTEKFAKWTGSKEGQKKMRDFFDDIGAIFKTIGGTITTIVAKMAPLIARMADFLAKHPKLVQLMTTAAIGGAVLNAVPGGGLVGQAASGLGSAAGSALLGGGRLGASGGVGLLGRAAPLLATPPGMVIAAGALAVGASYALSPDARKITNTGFRDALKDVNKSFDGLKRSFGQFWDKYGDEISRFGNLLAKWIATEFTSGIETLGDAIEVIADSFSLLFDALSGDWGSAWDDLQDVFGDLWDLFSGSPVGRFVRSMVGMFDKALDAVKKWWNDTGKPWFQGLPGRIWGWIEGAWHFLTDPIGKAFGDLIQDIKDLWNKTKSFFTDLPGKIWGWIKSAWRDLSESFNTYTVNLREAIKDRWDGAKSFFTGLPGKIWGWVRSGWSDLSDGFTKAVRGLVNNLGDIWDNLQTKFSSVVNWIITHVVNPLIDKINWVLDKLGGGKDTISHVGTIGTKPKPHYSSASNPGRGQLDVGVASGGVLPGFTPGRDVHHFFSPTVGALHLSGGEAIMRPEWVKLVGGPKVVEELNAQARQIYGGFGDQSFRQGGLYRPVKSGSAGGIHDTSTGFPAVDIPVPVGTPVSSGAAGKVTLSADLRGYEPRVSPQNGYRSYGRYIKIAHDGFQTLYAHLSKRGVAAHTNVTGGQLIGLSGSTGHSYGPHLHFGAAGISPLAFMSGSSSQHGTLGNITGDSSADGGFSFNPVTLLSNALSSIRDKIVSNVPGGDIGKRVATGVLGLLKNKAIDFVKDKATSLFNTVLGAGANDSPTGSVQQMARSALQARGWGDQWGAFNSLINSESGWNAKAENPTSTASGLFQFIDSTARAYGLPGHASNFGVAQQIVAGMKYIGDRYGSPNAAWTYHLRHGTYGNGGPVPGSGPGDHVPALLTPGEFVMRKPVVDRIGVDTLNRINDAANNLPFRSPADEAALSRRLDALVTAIGGQPRAVYAAEHVHVDTEADFSRLQQLADWAERGVRVA